MTRKKINNSTSLSRKRKRNKSLNKRKRNKTTKRKRNKTTRRNKTYRKKGGNGEDTVNCCVCPNEVNITNTLMPSGCKRAHGTRAHRICNDCWWNTEKGFGKEDSKHKCPGCEKGFPLTKVKLEEHPVIDLTLDDSDEDN